eukprot:3903586-Prymnesium_polylepis.1
MMVVPQAARCWLLAAQRSRPEASHLTVLGAAATGLAALLGRPMVGPMGTERRNRHSRCRADSLHTERPGLRHRKIHRIDIGT